jgi:flavin reductase (DIM6/NTAB) family NADH-FMN oxidoreductase RutF
MYQVYLQIHFEHRAGTHRVVIGETTEVHIRITYTVRQSTELKGDGYVGIARVLPVARVP